MNPSRLFLISLILKMLPASRCFKFKICLLRFAGIKVHKSSRIYSNVRIFGNGELIIGEDTFIGHETTIICNAPSKVQIGNFVDIAPMVYIGTGSHEIDMESKHIAGKGLNTSISIGDGSWIGTNSVILPGVIIGEKVVIGAGSIVTRNIPSFSIATGIPAKIQKTWDFINKEWLSQ